MQISELMEELAGVLGRFGDLEVRSGSSIITRLAVLPYAVIEKNDNGTQPNMRQFVALLSRHEDKSAPAMNPLADPT